MSSRKDGSAAALAVKAENVEYALKEVCALVSKIAGIQLGERQYSMVESRLRIRMLKLGITNLNDYLKHLRENLDEESVSLLSLLTTHHTYFFREFSHFEFILDNLMKDLIAVARTRADRKIYIWSAACSRGQEVYSLAMFMQYHLSKMAPDVKYEIWGTDVDPESVTIAKNGVYLYKDLMQVPAVYMDNHWVRGTGDIADYAKVKKSLKDNCHFTTGNLVKDTSGPSGKKFDLILCRNVFIYFNNDQIQQVCQYLIRHLEPQGKFFIGVSESLAGLDLPIEPVGPSIYGLRGSTKKLDSAQTNKETSTPNSNSILNSSGSTKNLDSVQAKPQSLIRVLCVDDSPSIHTLLKKVLSKENGFEIVGTALNGQEAIDLAKRISFDIMTLDIHMPVMDGLEYLRINKGKAHPPIVMLSSVQRENADIAMKAMDDGACDYVEKPNLANLLERGDEIRSKLKTAFLSKGVKSANRDLERSFSKKFTITKPETKTRIVFVSLGDREKIASLIKLQTLNDPPLVFVFEGVQDAVASLGKNLASATGKVIEHESKQIEVGHVYLLGFDQVKSSIPEWLKKRKTSVYICGAPTQKLVQMVMDSESLHLVLEDVGPSKDFLQKDILEAASAITPITSFFSLSEEHLQ